MDSTLQWLSLNSGWLGWLGALSLLTIVLSMIIVPILIVRMQPDYFLEQRDTDLSVETRQPIVHLLAKLAKNIIGGILLIGGVLMCLLPGQGLLTILIGLAVMDFPGKRRAEIWLFRRKPINWAVNKIRTKANRSPLLLPELTGETSQAAYTKDST